MQNQSKITTVTYVKIIKSRFGQKELPLTVRRKLQDIKQENKTVEEFAEQVHAMVTEGHPDAPESVIDTIATDTFLKGIENKRAALTAMNKDPTTLESALQLVKAAINNQRLILGGRKPEVRKVRFNDAYSDSDEETEYSLAQSGSRVVLTSLLQKLIP